MAYGPNTAHHLVTIGPHKIPKMKLHIMYVCMYCHFFANTEEMSDNDKSKAQHYC